MKFKNLFKKRKKSGGRDLYIEKVISKSQDISLADIKFFDGKNLHIQKLFSQNAIEDFDAKMAICDIYQSSVATKMFSDDIYLDVLIILSFNEIYIYIRNDESNKDEIDRVSRLIVDFKTCTSILPSKDYYRFEISIDDDKLKWFDRARFNAFMKAAGNIEMQIINN